MKVNVFLGLQIVVIAANPIFADTSHTNGLHDPETTRPTTNSPERALSEITDLYREMIKESSINIPTLKLDRLIESLDRFLTPPDGMRPLIRREFRRDQRKKLETVVRDEPLLEKIVASVMRRDGDIAALLMESKDLEDLDRKILERVYRARRFKEIDPKFRGSYLGEGNQGKFVMTSENLDQVTLLKALLRDPKHELTILVSREFLTSQQEARRNATSILEKSLTPAERKRVKLVDSPSILSRWIQDYRYLEVRDEAGQLTALDADYFPSDPHRTAEDRFPSEHSKPKGVSEKPFPLKLEGGNLSHITTPDGGSFTVISEQVLAENRKLGLSHSETREIAEQYLGPIVWVPPQDDGTGHVDMQFFVKRRPQGDVAFVGTISEEHLKNPWLGLDGAREATYSAPSLAVAYVHDKHAASISQSGLDETARRLQSKGVEVIRVPIPPPNSGQGKTGRASRSFSPTNAITTKDSVILPLADGHPLNRDPRHREALTHILKPYFKNVLFVEGETLGREGGGPHCSVWQPLSSPF